MSAKLSLLIGLIAVAAGAVISQMSVQAGPTPSPSPTPTPTPTPFCAVDTWVATSATGAPSRRGEHSAIWTGSEMIIWGGIVSPGPVFTNTGGKYNPVTDSWTATSTTNAPQARQSHTAIWTGTEMIVWGGTWPNGNGSRYNPNTDTWVFTTAVNAPAARSEHTAIWTGNEMIVWGGRLQSSGSLTNSGAKYHPGIDTWTPTSAVNAPAPRSLHTAVWTGTEMLVWGGNASGGARYNPSTDTWTPISTTNAPADRTGHSAVWTGTEMIVWGGNGNLNTGGKYNPTTDSWTPTSVTDVPLGRGSHSAVWTGLEMIVWGGVNVGSSCELQDGGRYDPTLDSWTPTTTTNAPQGRVIQTEVWTGHQMIVWGGSRGDVGCPDFVPSLPNYLNSGGRYCAQPGPTPTPPPASDFAIAMTDYPDPVKLFERVKYTISVSNPGPDFGTNVTMTDTPPPQATFVCATSSQGTCTGTGPVTCNLGPVQSNAKVTMMVKLPMSGAPGQITNTASVPYSADPNQSNNTATEVTAVAQATATPISLEADLAVHITDAPDPVTVGQPLTYNITISNFGPSIVDMTLTDNLPASVQLVSVNSSNACCTGPNPIYCYWDNRQGFPPSVTVVVIPTVAGTLSNTVSVQGYGHDPDLGDNQATATTTVVAPGTPTPTPGPATHFKVQGPQSPNFAYAGHPFDFFVTAQDNANNTAASYTGVVHFTSTDSTATLPGDSTLTNGTGTFQATLNHTNQTITATDTVNASITGTSNPILVFVDDATPTPAPSPTPTASPTPGSNPAQARNLATRLRVQGGDNVGIGGFIISGNALKKVAVRGIGPSLAGFGLTDFLADPTLELRDSNGLLLISNDDWHDTPTDQGAQLIAAGLAPTDPKESGFVATLPPGASYTAILAGKNQTAGVGLVEIYDIDQTAVSELANISTRGFVLNGNNVMIGGFILGGGDNTRIVVRGLGPSLAQFGLNPVLADPTLEVRDNNGALLLSDDDWQDDPTGSTAVQLLALGLAPQNAKESAIVGFLPPGAFTAILAGKNGGTGIGLVEIYNVH